MDQALSELLETDIESVKLETDTNGFIRVMFGKEELEEVNSYLSSELNKTYEDHLAIWSNAVENLETYKAIKTDINGSGPAIYPAPLARIPADQVIASTYNLVMQPKPVFAIDAYLKATYQTPQPTLPGAPPSVVPVTAEDCAKQLRRSYEFLVRERIDFGRKALKAIGGAVKGCQYVWKVAAAPNEATKLAPKINGAILDLDDKYESTRQRGDIVQHYLVPCFNFMKPVDEDDLMLAEWCSERTPNKPSDVFKKWKADENFLIQDDSEAQNLSKNTVDVYDPYRAKAEASEKKKSAQAPTQVCDIWLTWFYWTVYYKGQDGKRHVKKMNLVGDFHLTAGKLLNCYLNQYEHQERPYEFIDQFEDGGSTVENMRYHQTVFTHAMQAEIKNAFHANNLTRWYDPDNSEIKAFLVSNPILGPGDNVPGINNKDWGYARAGTEHASLLELMKFVLTMSQLDSKQSRYSSGDIPGRTPAYTMQQALQQAGEEPHLFLHRLSSKFSRILRLDMETRRQFQPLGETLPVWDEEEKAIVEIPFKFPVGDVMDNFRIALTASDEALAKETDPQQIMAVKQALMTDGEYIAKVLAPILNTQTPIPASVVKLFQKIMDRDQKALVELVGAATTDEDAYDLTQEIQAFVDERNQQLQQQQQMEIEMQHAQMMNGGQQQGPKTEPPRVSFTLSGQMPPEMVIEVAKLAGIEVPNAMQAPQGGAPVSGQPGAGVNGGANAAPQQQAIPPHPGQIAAEGSQVPGGVVQ